MRISDTRGNDTFTNVTIRVEALAEELHKTYRAAFKAFHNETVQDHMKSIDHLTGALYGGSHACTKDHDHGWSHCNKKKYFRSRAQKLLQSLL